MEISFTPGAFGLAQVEVEYGAAGGVCAFLSSTSIPCEFVIIHNIICM